MARASRMRRIDRSSLHAWGRVEVRRNISFRGRSLASRKLRCPEARGGLRKSALMKVRLGQRSLLKRVRRQSEFLDALAFDLAGIDIALAVDGHGVQQHELSGIAPAMAEGADHAAVLALDHADFVVGTVGV